MRSTTTSRSSDTVRRDKHELGRRAGICARAWILPALLWLTGSGSGCATIISVNRLCEAELHAPRRLDEVQPRGLRSRGSKGVPTLTLAFSDGDRQEVSLDAAAVELAEHDRGAPALLLLDGEFRSEVPIDARAQAGRGGRTRHLRVARALHSAPVSRVLFKGRCEPDPWSDDQDLQVMTLARIVAVDDQVIRLERLRTVSLRFDRRGGFRFGELAWRTGVILPALALDLLTLPLQGGLFAVIVWSGRC